MELKESPNTEKAEIILKLHKNLSCKSFLFKQICIFDKNNIKNPVKSLMSGKAIYPKKKKATVYRSALHLSFLVFVRKVPQMSSNKIRDYDAS